MNQDNKISVQEYVDSLLKSGELYDAAERVANKFGLHVDQLGEIAAQIEEVLRGRAKSSEFTKDIQKYLDIDESLANQITLEVNKEVFEAIKDKFKFSVPDQSSTSDISRLGGFTIDNSGDTENNAGNEQSRESATVNTVAEALDGIENPPPAKKTIVNKGPEHVDPLVDHLLTTPVAMPAKKVDTTPKIAYSKDPYH
jgi:hypothetical protein